MECSWGGRRRLFWKPQSHQRPVVFSPAWTYTILVFSRPFWTPCGPKQGVFVMAGLKGSAQGPTKITEQ